MFVGKDALSYQNAYEYMFLCWKPRFCVLIKRKELTRTKASVYSKSSAMEVGHRVLVSGHTSTQAPEMPLRLPRLLLALRLPCRTETLSVDSCCPLSRGQTSMSGGNPRVPSRCWDRCGRTQSFPCSFQSSLLRVNCAYPQLLPEPEHPLLQCLHYPLCPSPSHSPGLPPPISLPLGPELPPPSFPGFCFHHLPSLPRAWVAPPSRMLITPF